MVHLQKKDGSLGLSVSVSSLFVTRYYFIELVMVIVVVRCYGIDPLTPEPCAPHQRVKLSGIRLSKLY